MWLTTHALYQHDDIFCIFGKSLFVIQKFEDTCKDIINWLHITKIVEDGKIIFLDDEYNSYCDKLSKIMLGNSIKSVNNIKHEFEIEDKEIDILKNAKDSRNWIAHKLCSDCILKNIYTSNPAYDIPIELKKHVINVIKGDYLVSKWSYEFHEKEP
jgi:hypothetical protein